MERLLELDLGDLIGIDGTVFRTKRGELSLRVDDFTVLAKSLRPPPDKHHGLNDVETRFRRRELDLIANEDARAMFITRARIDLGGPPLPRRRGLPRGRDAGAAAALRRRAGAAVHDPPQRARPRPLPADRDRAVPQALHRRRARARLRARQGLPQRGRLATSTTPSSRWSSGTRPTPTTRTRCAALETLVARVAEALRLRRRARLRAAVAARDAARRDPRGRPASTSSRTRDATSLAAAIEAERGRHADRRPHLAAARRRPAQQVRRADAHPTRRSSSTTRRSCRRSPRTTAASRGSSSASRPSCAGMEIANAFTELNDPDEQRAPLRGPAARCAAERRRGGAALRRGLRRGARAGHAADRRRRARHRPARRCC